MKLEKKLTARSILFIFSSITAMDQKELKLTLDGSYLVENNTSKNQQPREKFNKLVTEWRQQLASGTMHQSEYDKTFLKLYHQGIVSGGFSSIEAEKFIPQLIKNEQKGIVEEAMKQAGISGGFSSWIGNHEIEARKLLVDRLAGRLTNIKDKTPKGIRDAIRNAFGDEKIPSKGGFLGGSFTTIVVGFAVWYVKSWVDSYTG